MPRSISTASRPSFEALALAVPIFIVYLLGACRTIYVGDSGELVAAAATLGIPHPSGYPLYVLLGKLWTLLVPLGSIAFRMSLFSACCAALACGGLHLVARRAGAGVLAAGFGATLLAFSPSFWSQANVQRVYSLNALFVVAVIGCALEWHRSRRIGWMVLAAFLTGIGACNHTVMAIVGLAVGLFALWSEPALIRRPLHVAACVGAAVVGLLPYVYLPLRSRQDPRLDWGDPETLERWRAVIFRHDFLDRAYLESAADLLPIAADYLSSLAGELLFGGAVIAGVAVVLGAAAGGLARGGDRERRWPVLLPLLVMAGNFLAMALHGSRSDLFLWHRYYIPSYLAAAFLAALGLEALVRRWGRRAAAALLIPLLLLIFGYPRFDRSRYTFADDFSRTLLSTLPPGAHLAATDDNILFVLIYLNFVEGVRPDVDLILQGVGNANLPPLRFDPATDPLFFTHNPNWQVPGLEVVPVGLVFRTAASDAPPPEPVIPKLELDGENDPRIPRDYLTGNLVGHFHYMLGLTFEKRDWPRAQRELADAARIAATNDVLHYNLGLIYRRNGLFRRSLESFERAAEINPRHIASNRPVRPSDRVSEARAEVERLAAIERALAERPVMAGLEAGSAAYHRRLAELLEAAGEGAAGHGHRLLALEAAAGEPVD